MASLGARTVYLARVVQYHAGFNFYEVTLENGGAIRKAVAGGATSVFASTALHIYAPGALVVAIDALDPNGIASTREYLDIIGGITTTAIPQSLGQSDYSDLAARVGYVFDKVHNYLPVERTQQYRPVIAGAGVPRDALSGEQGAFSPMGPAWLIGLAMAYLRAGDRCGIWMFSLDEHIRTVAKSIEQQTMAREIHEICDDGEVSIIERVAFVPWEAQGAFESGVPTGIQNPENIVDPLNPPTGVAINTVKVDQRAIFRQLDLQGYLGDLQDRFVTLPVGGTGIDTYSGTTEVHQGVFRSLTSADGTFWLQSAKGIHLEKYPLIQVPVETKTYDDPSGDTPLDYKASGTYGGGETQKRADYVPPSNESYAGDRGILGLGLHGAYISKAALQTLRAHKKDWRVQDEGTTPFAAKGLKGALRLPVDGQSLWGELPTFVELPVQKGRWESVKYYSGRSALDMWDDGSVVLEDAWGSQIIMTGGNIVLTCPGDVITAPGRSVITMAPQDIVQRAGNSVDITATRRDVTIKAEINLKAIGGNAGSKGGVLLENRGAADNFNYGQAGEQTDIAGLVIKSKGAAAFVGHKVSVISEGDLALQAEQVYGAASTMHLECAAALNIALGDTSKLAKDPGDKVSYIFKTDSCFLGIGGAPKIVAGGGLTINGSFIAGGTASIAGALQVAGSTLLAGGVAAPNEQNTPMSSAAANAVKTAIAQGLKLAFDSVAADAKKALTATRGTVAALLGAAMTYFAKTDVIAYVKGSLRTPRDYRTEGPKGFLLTQWRWQSYMQGSGGTWSEKAVEGPTGPTSPWPGDAWTSGASYLVYDLKVFDVAAGNATAGGETPAGTVSRTSAQNGYLVNSLET